MPTTTADKKAAPTATGPAAARTAPALGRELTPQSDDQPLLSIRASVPAADADTFIAAALHDIRVYLQEHHVTPAGPPFSICRRRGSMLDVEAGWPTAKPLAGTGRIRSGALPRLLTGPGRLCDSTRARGLSPAGM